MYFIFKLVVIYYAIWKIRQYEFYLDLFTPANRLYWYTTSLYFPNSYCFQCFKKCCSSENNLIFIVTFLCGRSKGLMKMTFSFFFFSFSHFRIGIGMVKVNWPTSSINQRQSMRRKTIRLKQRLKSHFVCFLQTILVKTIGISWYSLVYPSLH